MFSSQIGFLARDLRMLINFTWIRLVLEHKLLRRKRREYRENNSILLIRQKVKNPPGSKEFTINVVFQATMSSSTTLPHCIGHRNLQRFLPYNLLNKHSALHLYKKCFILFNFGVRRRNMTANCAVAIFFFSVKNL